MGEIEGSFKLFGRTIQLAKEGVCPEKATVDAKKMGQREEESALSTAAALPPTRPESKNLPCPRCRSDDTKFCYYNNYNANQPRHYCRNCQRYWTAGGAMRNVPVGAGRRKCKSSVAHEVAVGDDVVAGTVLSFGGGRIADARATVYGWMGGHGGEYSCGSSVTGSSSMEEAGNCAVYPFLSGNYWAGNWLAPPPQLSPPATATTTRTRSLEFGSSSPPGKRSSIGDLKERRGLIPESLRIDDQAEAARSSVGLTGVFQPKKGSKWQAMAESNRVVSSNPAAISRSINFQEMV